MNSKLFFPETIVVLGCFSCRSLQCNFANDVMGQKTEENNIYREKQLILNCNLYLYLVLFENFSLLVI